MTETRYDSHHTTERSRFSGSTESSLRFAKQDIDVVEQCIKEAFSACRYGKRIAVHTSQEVDSAFDLILIVCHLPSDDTKRCHDSEVLNSCLSSAIFDAISSEIMKRGDKQCLALMDAGKWISSLFTSYFCPWFLPSRSATPPRTSTSVDGRSKWYLVHYSINGRTGNQANRVEKKAMSIALKNQEGGKDKGKRSKRES